MDLCLPERTKLVRARPLPHTHLPSLAAMPKRAKPSPTAAAAAPPPSAPVEQHLGLWLGLLGEWTAESTFYWGPEPMVTEASASAKVVMGGQFVEMTYDSEIPGMGKFSGKATFGFNSNRKEYEHVWMDNASSELYFASGPLGKGKKKHVVEVLAERFDHKLQKQKATRMTYEFDPKTPGQVVCESYATVEGGKETLEMRMVYKSK
jgi:hypothetical protein